MASKATSQGHRRETPGRSDAAIGNLLIETWTISLSKSSSDCQLSTFLVFFAALPNRTPVNTLGREWALIARSGTFVSTYLYLAIRQAFKATVLARTIGSEFID